MDVWKKTARVSILGESGKKKYDVKQLGVL